MDIRIITYNVNGIRRLQEGFFRLAKNAPADIICLQEIKAQPQDIEIQYLRSWLQALFLQCRKKDIVGRNPDQTAPDNMQLGNRNLQMMRGRVIRADMTSLWSMHTFLQNYGDERQSYKY